MSKSPYERAVVILNLDGDKPYQEVSSRIRVERSPSWMMSTEEIIDISFDTSGFTDILDSLMHMHGKAQPPPVDILLTSKKGKMSHVPKGTIQDWWPSMIKVFGHIVPGEPSTRTYEIISDEMKEQIRIERIQNNKLIEQPDLNRFRIIDWED